MRAYLDTSVLVRRLLGERDPLQEWDEIELAVTSALTETELLRTLDRLRFAAPSLDFRAIARRREEAYRLFEELEVVELTRSVLMRASQPLPVALGTLDAIHLVSAQAWWEVNEPLHFATHDHALAAAARASGFHVIGA
ncbi:MAG: PIN domain-containing protein [Anaeromyxobacteraceae bacterium]